MVEVEEVVVVEEEVVEVLRVQLVKVVDLAKVALGKRNSGPFLVVAVEVVGENMGMEIITMVCWQ